MKLYYFVFGFCSAVLLLLPFACESLVAGANTNIRSGSVQIYSNYQNLGQVGDEFRNVYSNMNQFQVIPSTPAASLIVEGILIHVYNTLDNPRLYTKFGTNTYHIDWTKDN